MFQMYFGAGTGKGVEVEELWDFWLSLTQVERRQYPMMVAETWEWMMDTSIAKHNREKEERRWTYSRFLVGLSRLMQSR